MADRIDPQLNRILRDAQARGVQVPVILTLASAGERARRALTAAGVPLPPRAADASQDDPVPLEARSADGAVAALRAGSGIGGHAVANSLEELCNSSDLWVLYFADRELILIGFQGGNAVHRTGA